MAFEAIRDLCGRKRPLEILAILRSVNALNYTDIECRIDTSSDVIVNSLDLLIEYGLVQRTERSKKNVQYSITDNGERVLEAAQTLESALSTASGQS